MESILTSIIALLPEELKSLVPSLLLALCAGALVGLERSGEGRAAGFRTFSLVALGSALITAPTVHPHLWHYLPPANWQPMDPTRVVQGIVTGVGFLGAGVIYKEGFNIRGLTTAACIWVVSAIGVMMGLGLYAVGGVATVAVLSVLTVFRRVEAWMPTRTYSKLSLSYPRQSAPSEEELYRFFKGFGMEVRGLSYRLDAKYKLMQYHLTLVSSDRKPVKQLVETLRKDAEVASFELDCANS